MFGLGQCNNRITINKDNNKDNNNKDDNNKYKIKHYNNNNRIIDCDTHIISKSETCLVESFNGSLRGRFARFNRRTKAYSKNFDNLKDAVFIWVNREQYLININSYSNRFIYTDSITSYNKRKYKILIKKD